LYFQEGRPKAGWGGGRGIKGTIPGGATTKGDLGDGEYKKTYVLVKRGRGGNKFLGNWGGGK